MNNEYTLDELKNYIKENSEDGKISLHKIAELVYDSRFPEALYKNASETLFQYSSDYRRYKELLNLLIVKAKEIHDYQSQIVEMIKAEMNHGNDFSAIKSKQGLLIVEYNKLEQEFNTLHKYFEKW